MTHSDSEKHVAPELDLLTPTVAQQFVIREVVSVVRDLVYREHLHARCAGQSTLRGMVARAILADEMGMSLDPLYEVRSIGNHDA